jgi:hypothetical protein
MFFLFSDLANGLLVAETLSDSIKATVNVNVHRTMLKASYPSLSFRNLMPEPKPKPGGMTVAQTTVEGQGCG